MPPGSIIRPRAQPPLAANSFQRRSRPPAGCSTSAEFHRLADVPPEIEWFANSANGTHARRIYENAVKDFMRFVGIRRPEEFRIVTARPSSPGGTSWRGAALAAARSAIGSPRWRRCFEYLCDKNAITHNPVKGVERPKSESRRERKTLHRSIIRRAESLEAPQGDDITRSKRDRAILSTLLFHALRREELCQLKVRDFRHARRGVPHLKVSGKGGKTRYVPLTSGAPTCLIDDITRRRRSP